jgi:hypothetical protein
MSGRSRVHRRLRGYSPRARERDRSQRSTTLPSEPKGVKIYRLVYQSGASDMKKTRMRTTRGGGVATKTVTFSRSKIAGRYAFRFNGFTMANDRLYYLSGIGFLSLAKDGKLEGQQKSSITAIQGQGAALQHSSFKLKGTYTLRSDGTGTARIDFIAPSGEINVTGDFDLLMAGTIDRFWLVSSGATAPGGAPADELTSGEAIRVSAN